MASIDKRPNGKWRARWREYPGGPQKAQHFERKADAQKFLTATEHSLLAGTYASPEEAGVTLRAYAERHLARQHWRPSTETTARAALEHSLKVLGNRPLNTIRRGDVQSVLAGIERSAGTVRLARQHLVSVLQAAVDDGLIPRNPANGVPAPRATAGEVVPPTTEQVTALHAAAPDWFRSAVVLGAGLGLRQAEVSGLTVDRIEWLGRGVRIDRQYQTKTAPFGFAPPKSAASVRTIPAGAAVLAELGHLVGARDGFVVTRDDGATPTTHNSFRYVWHKTTKAADLEGMKFHALRHYFASALISSGCSIKAVQKALGHTSAAVTLDVYGHLFPGDEDRIRAALDGVFSAEDSLRTEDAG